MMRAFCLASALCIAGLSLTATAVQPAPQPAPAAHRYLIERTFPAGAIDGVDAAAKQKVNANNESLDVNWEKSYATADKTKTYCVYTGPSEAAVREAAKLNGLPVDVVTEIPSDIKPEPRGAVQKIEQGKHRYLVKRHGTARVHGELDPKFGVTLLTSYGTANHEASYWVYEAPDFSAIESAAKAANAPFESIVEIPETVYPR